jgi:hypothetical protein
MNPTARALQAAMGPSSARTSGPGPAYRVRCFRSKIGPTSSTNAKAEKRTT